MSPAPRPLHHDDVPAMIALGQEAFGALHADYTPPTPDEYPQPGRHSWGSFDGDRLVAKVLGREYHSWFHGSSVATTGIAGVTSSSDRAPHRRRYDLTRSETQVAAPTPSPAAGGGRRQPRRPPGRRPPPLPGGARPARTR